MFSLYRPTRLSASCAARSVCMRLAARNDWALMSCQIPRDSDLLTVIVQISHGGLARRAPAFGRHDE